jgi:hypothetical protein
MHFRESTRLIIRPSIGSLNPVHSPINAKELKKVEFTSNAIGKVRSRRKLSRNELISASNQNHHEEVKMQRTANNFMNRVQIQDEGTSNYFKSPHNAHAHGMPIINQK